MGSVIGTSQMFILLLVRKVNFWNLSELLETTRRHPGKSLRTSEGVPEEKPHRKPNDCLENSYVPHKIRRMSEAVKPLGLLKVSSENPVRPGDKHRKRSNNTQGPSGKISTNTLP